MSFPSYPAYKDSGVEWLGDVPQSWSVYSLKRTVDGCVNGLWGDEPDGENDIAVIRVADFERSFSTVGLDKLTYRSITPKERQSRLIKSGDLLIEKSGGGEKTLVGCVVLFTHEFEAITSNFVARMRPLAEFDNQFLCYAFGNLYHGRVNYPSVKQVTGIQNLDAESYLQERFCFPSRVEQTQIARFLDHETARIDALIEEQQRLIELLKEKRQAVISHAVTRGLDPTVPMKDSGMEWLGEVPAHWNVIRLGQNIRTRKGFAFSAADFSDEGAAVVKASDIKNHSINEPSTFIGFEFLKKTPNAILKKGNLVLSTVGSTPDVKNSAVGQIGCVPEHLDGALLNQNTVIFEPTDSRVSSEYLFFALLTTAYRDHLDLNAHGTANQASLSLSDMLSFCIPLPDLDEQKAISSELSRVLENVKTLERESESLVGLLTERRSALISAAVTGKIDVRGWQPPASAQAPLLELEAV
jgi:type I restriction enzyme S subunit